MPATSQVAILPVPRLGSLLTVDGNAVLGSVLCRRPALLTATTQMDTKLQTFQTLVPATCRRLRQRLRVLGRLGGPRRGSQAPADIGRLVRARRQPAPEPGGRRGAAPHL